MKNRGWPLGLMLILSSGFASGATVRSAERGHFDGVTSLSRSNSLYNMQDGTEAASMDGGISLSYAKDVWSAGVNLEASQDLMRPENSDLTSFVLGFKRKDLRAVEQTLIVTPGISLSLPVSKDQRLRQGLIAGTTANLRIEMNPDRTSFKRLNLATALSATRNFHTYEEKSDGSLNTEYSSKQGFEVGYKVSEKISLVAVLAHIDTFSYMGGHRETYSHSEEAEFDITKSTNLALGHQLGSSIRKANGEDYNFQLTDETQSIVYVSLSMSF